MKKKATFSLGADLGQTGDLAENTLHSVQQTSSDRLTLDPEAEEYADSLARALINETNDAYTSFQTAAGTSVLAEKLVEMEFTKNYSDDLLMNNGAQQGEMSSADLVDFESPPYLIHSESSSGNESKQHSPIGRQSPSTTSSPVAAAQATSSQQTDSSSLVAPTPNLCAVKDLLLTSYSKVSHILSWRHPIESGVIFSIGATLILALSFFSIISVIAYSALGIILTSGTIRAHKTLMKTLNRSSETPIDHIWNSVLNLDVSVSSEKLHELIEISYDNLNASMVYFKQVLLLEDKIATLKCALLLYLLTYIGAWFNGMTLITISYLALFSVPIVYEKNKTTFNEYVHLVTGQLSSTISMVSNRASSMTFGSSSQTAGGNKKNN